MASVSKWFADEKEDTGLQIAENSKCFGITSSIMSFSNEGKELISHQDARVEKWSSFEVKISSVWSLQKSSSKTRRQCRIATSRRKARWRGKLYDSASVLQEHQRHAVQDLLSGWKWRQLVEVQWSELREQEMVWNAVSMRCRTREPDWSDCAVCAVPAQWRGVPRIRRNSRFGTSIWCVSCTEPSMEGTDWDALWKYDQASARTPSKRWQKLNPQTQEGICAWWIFLHQKGEWSVVCSGDERILTVYAYGWCSTAGQCVSEQELLCKKSVTVEPCRWSSSAKPSCENETFRMNGPCADQWPTAVWNGAHFRWRFDVWTVWTQYVSMSGHISDQSSQGPTRDVQQQQSTNSWSARRARWRWWKAASNGAWTVMSNVK